MASTADVVEALVNRFERLRRKPSIDEYEPEGRRQLVSQLHERVAAGLPVVFLLPAYASKCNAVEKVIAPGVADQAEWETLATLGSFAEDVGQVYENSKLVIVSDWRVYGAPLGTPEELGIQYFNQIRNMTAHSPHLHWASLDDFCHPEADDCDSSVTDVFLTRYGQPMEDVKRCIAEDENRKRVQVLFSGFVRAEVRNASEEEALDRAMDMMRRHDAYNKLLAGAYPGHVRLSIHTTANKDNKYCINLLDNGCDVQPTTPWHGVLAVSHLPMPSDSVSVKQVGFEIISKSEAEARNLQLVVDDVTGLLFYRSEGDTS